MKNEDSRELSKKQQAELDVLAALPDDRIDTSDVPEVRDWSNAKRGLFRYEGTIRMATPQWIKKLGGHAGELYVCAELSKRGIPNALLPENFTDDDILVGDKAAKHVGFIQVKACHPDRSRSFILKKEHENWRSAEGNQFCAFVWLGRISTFEPPRYWLALKREVGEACLAHSAHGTMNWERRFFPRDFPAKWENQWTLFDKFRLPVA